MYVVMKNAGLSTKELNFKVQLEKDIEEAKSKLQRNESEFTNEKNRLQTDIGKLKDLNTKLENEKKTLGEKCKKIETENNNLVNESKTIKEDKKSLELQISKLNAELSSKSTRYFYECYCLLLSCLSGYILNSIFQCYRTFVIPASYNLWS